MRQLRKFEVTVEREDRYVIEIDDKVHDEEWMDHFKQYFYDIVTLQEHAEHIAQMQARFGVGFLEGYGNVLVNGKRPIGKKEREVNKAINIQVVSEDDSIWIDSKEVE